LEKPKMKADTELQISSDIALAEKIATDHTRMTFRRTVEGISESDSGKPECTRGRSFYPVILMARPDRG
jgi:hypothetical protein